MAAAVNRNPLDHADNLTAILADGHWRRSVEARYWPKVDKSDGGCWLWTGARNMHGYGRLKVASYTTEATHRLSYALHFGHSPGDLCVCHRCDTPACVNPAHLFLGTHKDNSDDKIAKGRARTGNQAGENNGAAKLSTADVDEIKALLRAGHNNKAIATRFGVTHQAISRIRRGRAWGDAPIHQPYASLRTRAVVPLEPTPPRLVAPVPEPPASPIKAHKAPSAAPMRGRGRKAILAAYKAARGIA